MTKEKKLLVSLKSAKRIAFTFFFIGTLLFLIQLLIDDSFGIAILGLVFIVVAVTFNTTILILLIIDLIRRDLLESFYSICLILVNIPIAIGYVYILSETIK